MTPRKIRMWFLLIVGAATAAGLLPADLSEWLESYTDAVVGVLMMLWGLFVWLRRKELPPPKS